MNSLDASLRIHILVPIRLAATTVWYAMSPHGIHPSSVPAHVAFQHQSSPSLARRVRLPRANDSMTLCERSGLGQCRVGPVGNEVSVGPLGCSKSAILKQRLNAAKRWDVRPPARPRICSSAVAAISSFPDDDTKNWHCILRTPGNLFQVTTAAYQWPFAKLTERLT